MSTMMSATHTKHRHKMATVQIYCFTGPIDGARPNPRAHGNVREVHTCRCGAARNRNVNGDATETGSWRPSIRGSRGETP